MIGSRAPQERNVVTQHETITKQKTDFGKERSGGEGLRGNQYWEYVAGEVAWGQFAVADCPSRTGSLTPPVPERRQWKAAGTACGQGRGGRSRVNGAGMIPCRDV